MTHPVVTWVHHNVQNDQKLNKNFSKIKFDFWPEIELAVGKEEGNSHLLTALEKHQKSPRTSLYNTNHSYKLSLPS